MYYAHTTLATLTQDDLYSIALFGGGVSVVLFAVAPLALFMHYIRKIDELRGDNILTTALNSLLKAFFFYMMYLFFLVFIAIVYMYGTSDATSLNLAESMEWFLRTDWIDTSLNLVDTIEAVKQYGGDDAVTIARDTVGIVYLEKLLFDILIIGYTVLITFSLITRINKMSNSNNVSGFEYSTTLGASAFLSVFVLWGVIFLTNSAYNEIFTMSDKLAKTNLSGKDIKIQHAYTDVLNPNILFKVAPKNDGTYNTL